MENQGKYTEKYCTGLPFNITDTRNRILLEIQKAMELQVRTEDMTKQVGTSLENQMAGMWKHFMDREDNFNQQLIATDEENAMLGTRIDVKEAECRDLWARVAQLDEDKAAHVCQAIPLPQSPPDADDPEIVKALRAAQEEASQLRGEIASKDSLVSELQSQLHEKEQQIQADARGYTDDVKRLTAMIQKAENTRQETTAPAVDLAHQEATLHLEREAARGKDLVEMESRKVDDLEGQLQASKETVAVMEENQRLNPLQTDTMRTDNDDQKSEAERAAKQARDRVAEAEKIKGQDFATISELKEGRAAAGARAARLNDERRLRDEKLASLCHQVGRRAEGYRQIAEINTQLRELAETRSRSAPGGDIVNVAHCVEALFEALCKHHDDQEVRERDALSADPSTQATGLAPKMTTDPPDFSLRAPAKESSKGQGELSSHFERFPGQPVAETHMQKQPPPTQRLIAADYQEFQTWGQDLRRVMLQSPHGVSGEPDPPSVGEEKARMRDGLQPRSIMKTRAASRLEAETQPVLPPPSTRQSRTPDTSTFAYGRYNRPVSGGVVEPVSQSDAKSVNPQLRRNNTTQKLDPTLAVAPESMRNKEAATAPRGANRKRKMSSRETAVPGESLSAGDGGSGPEVPRITRTYGLRRRNQLSKEPSPGPNTKAAARTPAGDQKPGALDEATRETISVSQQTRIGNSQPQLAGSSVSMLTWMFQGRFQG